LCGSFRSVVSHTDEIADRNGKTEKVWVHCATEIFNRGQASVCPPKHRMQNRISREHFLHSWHPGKPARGAALQGKRHPGTMYTEQLRSGQASAAGRNSLCSVRSSFGKKGNSCTVYGFRNRKKRSIFAGGRSDTTDLHPIFH